MKIWIKTSVAADHHTVWAGFNEDLFKALKPPVLPLTLKRFDGSLTGDEVHLTLGMGWLAQDWNARIIEHQIGEEECYFIDEGIQLPFFLKSWQHRHRIVKQADGSTAIIDDIDFRTPFWLMDYLMYPIMYLQFYARKPVYKRIFGSVR